MRSVASEEYLRYESVYLQRAESLHISRESLRAPILSDRKYKQLFDASLRIRIYLQRNMREITKSVNLRDHSFLIGLFNKEEPCLLEWWGSPAIKDLLRQKGIFPGTLCTFSAMGPNAVTVGFAEDRAMFSVGSHNYNLTLQEWAIYFTPFSVAPLSPAAESADYGIALFVPAFSADELYQLTLNAATYGLIMTMHMNQTCHKIYSMISPGFLGLDARLSGEENTQIIAFHDEEIAQILGIPRKDYSFERLDSIIDPLPANTEFWKLLSEDKNTSEYHLPLTCQGVTKNYILSYVSLKQPGIGAAGSYLRITTRQRQNMDISRRIGGSAVLRMEDIIGESPKIRAAVSRAKLAAQIDRNVILLGESGVGKDVFAQAIHNASHRSHGPFIAINCGALPKDLIASELFGYVGGSFTGARKNGNIGKFELANGGTLFLDEIGELPYDLQATLLRVVEQKQLTRIGGNETINVDVKIISATNEDLPSMIERHRFREDLYFRLSSMFVEIPPLRDRGNDVLLLADYFAARASERVGRTFRPSFSPQAQALLLRLPFRGNVRGLENIIENIVQLYPVEVITDQHLLENITSYQLTHLSSPDTAAFPHTRQSSDRPVSDSHAAGPYGGNRVLTGSPYRRRNDLTPQTLTDALLQCGGNRSAAARLLGVSRATLYRYLSTSFPNQ